MSSTKEVYSDMFYYNTKDKAVMKKGFVGSEDDYGGVALKEKSKADSFGNMSK